jgi:NodT family efflux transporter outer membrane factor (OMF) lipoprotein
MMRALLLLSAALTGCGTVGPVYERPDTGLRDSDTFVWAAAPAASPTPADLHWWRHFQDPLLTQWVERALTGNPDVAIAFERVAQAQALLRSAAAARRPSLGGRLQAGASERRVFGGDDDQSTAGAGVSAGLAFDWNVDLWGGLQQAERSAAASLLQRQDLAQAARLATASMAARGYIEWREAQLEQALLQQTLDVRQQTLRLVEVRVDAGLAPSLDRARAQAELAAVQADLDAATGRMRQAALALHTLAGERPAPLPATQQPPRMPQLAVTPPVPRPVDLLRLRPDVRAAERALIAAVAEVGVANAAIYPDLRLPGDLLLTAAGLGTDAIVRTLTASLSALLQVPLLDGGQRSAGLDAARSRAREAALLYRKTVLSALQQVEHALVAGQTADAQRTARLAAAEAAETALGQARMLYTEGLSGYADVLEVQRTWLSNRLQLIRADADRARAAVALFDAAGLIDTPAPATP